MMRLTTCLTGLVAGAIVVVGHASVAIGQFDDVANWAAFDPGDHDVGANPDGYFGAAFDGRYVYFAPSHNGVDYHCEVLRYDTLGEFVEGPSWVTYDPGLADVGVDPRGYFGAVFDGRYVYFVPHRRSFTDFHAEVLRFDTEGNFFNPASWDTYDPEGHVGTRVGGYIGGVFDGQYVYFVPNYINGSYNHGEVLRYNTMGEFSSVSSWATFDPGNNSIGSDPDGYSGAAFDGRYVYFSPLHNGSEWHGEVLRYDTQGNFDDPGSWEAYDYGAVCGENCTDPDGYSGAVFDGRYVYFTPFLNGVSHHGEVLRYDTEGNFTGAGSWTTYDAGAHDVGYDADGFLDGVFDGRYIYFVPDYNGSDFHSEVLRYDILEEFSDAASWYAYDPTNDGVGSESASFAGGVFDGRYVYFVPNNDGQQYGEVMRYDTRTGIPTVSQWGLIVMTLLILVVGTIVAMWMGRRREQV